MSSGKENYAWLEEQRRRREEEERRRREEERKREKFQTAKRAALRDCDEAQDALRRLTSNPFASKSQIADYVKKADELHAKIKRFADYDYDQTYSLKKVASSASSLEAEIQRFAVELVALENRRSSVQNGAERIKRDADSSARFDSEYWSKRCERIVSDARSCADKTSLAALEVAFSEIEARRRKIDDEIEGDEKRMKAVRKEIVSVASALKRLEELVGIKEEREASIREFELSLARISTRLGTPEQGCDQEKTREILDWVNAQIGEIEKGTRSLREDVETLVSKKKEIDSLLNELKRSERRMLRDEAAPFLTSDSSATACFSSYRDAVDEIRRSFRTARNLNDAESWFEPASRAKSKLEEAFSFALDAWIQANLDSLRERLDAKLEIFNEVVFQRWAYALEPDEYDRLKRDFLALDEESRRCDDRATLCAFGKRVAKQIERVSRLVDKIERSRERFDRLSAQVANGQSDASTNDKLSNLRSLLKGDFEIMIAFRNKINDVVAKDAETKKRVGALVDEAERTLRVEFLQDAVRAQESFTNALDECCDLVDLWRQAEEFRRKVQPLTMELLRANRSVYEKIEVDVRAISSLIEEGESDKARRLLDKTRTSNAELLAKAERMFRDREVLRQKAEKIEKEVSASVQEFLEGDLARFLTDDESSLIRESLEKTRRAYERGEFGDCLGRAASMQIFKEQNEKICRRRFELSDLWLRFTANGQDERFDCWAKDDWNRSKELYGELNGTLERSDDFDSRLLELKDALNQTLRRADEQEGALREKKEAVRNLLAELDVKLSSILSDEHRGDEAFRPVADEIEDRLDKVANWRRELERCRKESDVQKLEKNASTALKRIVPRMVEDFEACLIASAYANALREMNYQVALNSNENGLSIAATLDMDNVDNRKYKEFTTSIPYEKGKNGARTVSYDFQNGTGFESKPDAEGCVHCDDAEQEVDRLRELLEKSDVCADELTWRDQPPKRRNKAEVVRDGSDLKDRRNDKTRYAER